ncbi:MAG: protein-L-isoaspartate(D-aspartate) O-methyltransferase [Bacteroidales bacterium]|nr:protein-L-isoaspartate(D-aspartate) O-methyltransferase [Bacteroidales bacterium]
MIDNYKHKGMRRRLVEEVKAKGITDAGVLDAIGKIPRHLFMDSSFENFAYQDVPFPIGSGQTISQPYTVGFQSQLLNIKKGDKVLEVGTGSGYQAIVLVEMGAKVFSIERQRKLYDRTRKLMHDMGYMAKLFYGDGYKGLPSYAPFDKIIVTAGAPEVPKQLLKQLKVGGLLVIPVGGDEGQVMYSISRISEMDFEQKTHGDFAFVPMLKNRARD